MTEIKGEFKQGQKFMNTNGFEYTVLEVKSNELLLLLSEGGWLFLAHTPHMYRLDNGLKKIAWDYSTDGTFNRQKIAKAKENMLREKILELSYKQTRM